MSYDLTLFDNCSLETITVPEATEMLSYTYNGDEDILSFTVAFKSEDPVNCSVIYYRCSLSLADSPDFCKFFDSATGYFEFKNDDKVAYPPGIYDITIAGSLTNSFSDTAPQKVYTLHLEDSCALALVTHPDAQSIERGDITLSFKTEFSSSDENCNIKQ